MTDLVTRVESALDDDEQLAEELPAVLEAADGRTKEFVAEHPEVFGRAVARMNELDVATFVSENPEVADDFQEFLWNGIEALVEQSPAVREEIATDITVNFEATDCPMSGHLVVDGDERTMRGGAGLLDDPTLEIEGPADVLVGLVTGAVDPIQGFLSQQYEMDGPVAKGTRLAPLMNDLSAELPG